MLVPKDGKLFCKACEKEFDLDTSKEDDYKIIKKIRHDEKESAPIVVKEGLRGERISAEDRKAFEEMFDISEADGY
ncbi:MAG: hypothetical protein JSV62_07930 [Promethearchaeota archaeon]|nr:MAG: hypothetical protein JSV62_07930 [Candidatus Lokiarchaeota archaeon]